MSTEAALASTAWTLDTLFRKTAKGVAEVQTRIYRLQPRLRSALILVDGHRRGVDLRPLIQQEPEATLRTLAEQGFIEAATPPAPPPRAPAAAKPAAPAAPNFETQRRTAVRLLNDLLGPAAETLAIRMERTRNMEELRPQIAMAVQAVGKLHGAAAAQNFAAQIARR